jgi:hypothetical protein
VDHLQKRRSFRIGSKWGTKGTSDGQFNKPHSMSNDIDGNVYVTDMNNHRIQKFTPEGKFVVG